MERRPPRSTRTDTPFPYTSRVRADGVPESLRDDPQVGQGNPHDLVRSPQAGDPRLGSALARRGLATSQVNGLGLVLQPVPHQPADIQFVIEEIGRANV